MIKSVIIFSLFHFSVWSKTGTYEQKIVSESSKMNIIQEFLYNKNEIFLKVIKPEKYKDSFFELTPKKLRMNFSKAKFLVEYENFPKVEFNQVFSNLIEKNKKVFVNEKDFIQFENYKETKKEFKKPNGAKIELVTDLNKKNVQLEKIPKMFHQKILQWRKIKGNLQLKKVIESNGFFPVYTAVFQSKNEILLISFFSDIFGIIDKYHYGIKLKDKENAWFNFSGIFNHLFFGQNNIVFSVISNIPTSDFLKIIRKL